MGHIPTGYINRNSVGKIGVGNHHIAIECGAVFGYVLGGMFRYYGRIL